MKKLLALLLAACMVVSMAACGSSPSSDSSADSSSGDTTSSSSSDDTYTVSIQFSFPEESAAGALKVLDEITEASDGRIQFEIYYSYSFVEAGDVVDALDTNQLDIAALMPSEHLAVFPLAGSMCALPLLNYPDWEASTKIYLNLLYNNEEMLAEYTDNGMIFWAGYMCPGYQFYSTSDITDLSPDVLNGLTIMCDNAQMQEFINNNNGGAISVYPTEYLSNLQNGVADALVQHVNCAYAFGCIEYMESALFFGESGFYNLPLSFAFSETFWNSLPEDIQAIFEEYADDMSYECMMSDVDLYENTAYPLLEENTEITVLDDDEIAEWQEAISPIVESALEDITNDSPTAPEVYEELTTMIDEYDADTFEIGTTNFGTEFEWE